MVGKKREEKADYKPRIVFKRQKCRLDYDRGLVINCIEKNGIDARMPTLEECGQIFDNMVANPDGNGKGLDRKPRQNAIRQIEKLKRERDYAKQGKNAQGIGIFQLFNDEDSDEEGQVQGAEQQKKKKPRIYIRSVNGNMYVGAATNQIALASIMTMITMDGKRSSAIQAFVKENQMQLFPEILFNCFEGDANMYDNEVGCMMAVVVANLAGITHSNQFWKDKLVSIINFDFVTDRFKSFEQVRPFGLFIFDLLELKIDLKTKRILIIKLNGQ